MSEATEGDSRTTVTAAPSGQAVPLAGQRKKRPVRCKLCDLARVGRLDDANCFPGPLGLLGSARVEDIEFVGSCLECDLDVCASCAKWSALPLRPGEAADEPTLAGRLARFALCPRCDRPLLSKTTVDLSRLARGLAVLETLPPAQANDLARRMREVCEDEWWVLQGMGAEAFRKLRETLEAAARR